MLASTSTRLPRSVDELISSHLCARLDRIDVLSRKVFAGKLQGERRSKRRGQSVEFADYRPYVAGDDLRRIDWNALARLDKFFIRIFLEEVDLSLHLVLDASASMDAGEPNKLIAAQRIAMALGYIGLVNNNRVSASVIGGGAEPALRRLAPLRGRRGVQRLGHFIINAVQPSTGASSGAEGRESFAEAMRSIARTRAGKGVMVILSDFLIPEGYQEGLRFIAGGGEGGGGWDAYALQILAPGELDPSLERTGAGDPLVIGDLKLTDAETGRAAEVTVTAALLKKYRAGVQRYIEELGAYCRARDIRHLLVPSDTDLEQLLLDYLRRRGLLR